LSAALAMRLRRRPRRRAIPPVLIALLAVSFAVTLIAALALLFAATPAHAGTSDPHAVQVADDVMKALGGRQKWDALPGLRWTFGSSVNDTVRNSRHHAWNKHTGWHRVEGKTRAGDAYVIIHNLNTGEGKAWMNGQAIEGDSLQKLIKRANSMWINDAYWFLMPYKLRDSGVTLAMAGDSTAGGATWDRIALSFENVGETPGDHYWVYVNRKSHRVERWDMVLQSDSPPPRTYSWEGWEQHDGLWFPTAHRQDQVNVFTRDVETVREFRPNEFTAP
jgi:hypothetical protein